jgi:predicted amidohydrolase
LTGSLKRLLAKNSESLRQAYLDTFGALAREFGTAIVAGSVYLYDEDSESIRNRSYLFDAGGDPVGWQDKLNPPAEERELTTPGTRLPVFQTKFGRVGILIGQDLLYPELARLLALQGADLIAGVCACPGTAQASLLRAALALRAEENQLYTLACFLVGPDLLGRTGGEDYVGQSALLAPAALSPRGDGILSELGSGRSEGVITALLQGAPLQEIRQIGGFRPRAEMNLAGLGPALAQFYAREQTLDQALEQRQAGAAEPAPASPPSETANGPDVAPATATPSEEPSRADAGG